MLGRRSQKTLTIIAAPVNVDAAAIVAGKLGEWKARGVGCGQTTPVLSDTMEMHKNKKPFHSQKFDG